MRKEGGERESSRHFPRRIRQRKELMNTGVTWVKCVCVCIGGWGVRVEGASAKQ